MSSTTNQRSDEQAQVLVANQTRSYYVENLICRREALEVLRMELPYAPKDAESSVKRIAHALSGTAEVFGFEEISRAALLTETANDGLLQVYLDNLIQVIEASVAASRAEKIKILVVDPDPDSVVMLELILSDTNREIITVSTMARAIDVLEWQDISFVLLEPALPDGDGRNLLVRIRARSKTAAIPVLVLSSWDSPQVKTECLALGADAFYEKPYDPATLSSSVSVWLQRRGSIDSKDPLTGLPDRIALVSTFERLRSFSYVAQETMSVAVFDYDHFEAINETFGYSSGDSVLRSGSELIRQMLRPGDVLARWEGNRFVVLLPSTRITEASEVLDRTLQTLRNRPFYSSDVQSFKVSFTAGIVEMSSIGTLDQAVADAVELLDAAKKEGGGRVFTGQTERTDVVSKIVLVEDDEVIAELISYRLQREGMQVVHFSDGAHALAEAQEHDASLVLLDVRLPGMDGFELLARLRRMPAYAKCPIIMLTAIGSEYDIVKGFELGADDYVLKPFSPLELVARVRRLLKRTV